MPMYYNRPTNTRWYFLKKSLEKEYIVPDSKIIFLGESRLNAAVDFTQISKAYSFASGGSTPIEMYYVLKKYTEKYSNPDTVFLSVSPRFLSETFAFYPYAVRNDFFSYSDFNEICKNLQANDTTIGKNSKLKFLIYKLHYLEYYQSDVLYNYVFAGYKENEELIKQMQTMKGGRPHPDLKDSCSNLNYETAYDHFIPAPILKHYFKKILSFCRDNNIHLIYTFVPMNKSSYNALKPAFIKEYSYFIKSFANHYPYFDISDTIYSYPDIYFGDESHLNSKGKVKYTKYIKEIYFKN